MADKLECNVECLALLSFKYRESFYSSLISILVLKSLVFKEIASRGLLRPGIESMFLTGRKKF